MLDSDPSSRDSVTSQQAWLASPASTKPAPQPRTAIPAVRVPPDADDYENWTDEDLIQFIRRALIRSDRYERTRTLLGRRAILELLLVGFALSILRRRHKNDGTWCAIQAQLGLSRTTVWETIEAYERSVKAGHSKEEVAASHKTWTEVIVAYGIVKERAKKEAVSIAAKAEPVDEGDEAHVGEIETAPADTDSSQSVQQEGGAVTADAVPASKAKTATKKDQNDDKAAQVLLEKPGAVEITEDESIAYRKFVESVGGLARAEVVFAEMKRRADHA